MAVKIWSASMWIPPASTVCAPMRRLMLVILPTDAPCYPRPSWGGTGYHLLRSGGHHGTRQERRHQQLHHRYAGTGRPHRKGDPGPDPGPEGLSGRRDRAAADPPEDRASHLGPARLERPPECRWGGRGRETRRLRG